jgi:DNA-binding protein Fis
MSYEEALKFVSKMNMMIEEVGLTDFHKAKPFLDGKEICQLYGIKPGKIMKPLMDEVMLFQITFPKVSKDFCAEFMMKN